MGNIYNRITLTKMNPEIVYKMMTHSEYETFMNKGTYEGNDMDKRDGYIHMSQNMEQCERVQRKYYPNQELILVHISWESLSNVRMEPISNGDMYPHQYGTMEFDSIVDISILTAKN